MTVPSDLAGPGGVAGPSNPAEQDGRSPTGGLPASQPPDGPSPVAPVAEIVPEQPGRGPALVILGIVALVCVFGLVFALLSTPSSSNLKPGERVKGSSLRAYAARSVLSPVVDDGEPPQDVLGNLVVPKGAHRLSSNCDNIDLYDCKVRFSLPESPPSVLAFYESALAHLGWKRLSVDPTDNGRGTEVLEQIGSNDGFYWEVGVFVDPSGGSVSASSGGGSSGGGSTVAMEVIEEDDGD